jgi:hypothetical protein
MDYQQDPSEFNEDESDDGKRLSIDVAVSSGPGYFGLYQIKESGAEMLSRHWCADSFTGGLMASSVRLYLRGDGADERKINMALEPDPCRTPDPEDWGGGWYKPETYGFIGQVGDIENFSLEIYRFDSEDPYFASELQKLVIGRPEKSHVSFVWVVTEEYFDSLWMNLRTANQKEVYFSFEHLSLHKEFDPNGMGFGFPGKFLAHDQEVDLSKYPDTELYRTDDLGLGGFTGRSQQSTKFAITIVETPEVLIPQHPEAAKLAEKKKRRLARDKAQTEQDLQSKMAAREEANDASAETSLLLLSELQVELARQGRRSTAFQVTLILLALGIFLTLL